MTTAVCAVDLGSTNVKASLVDAGGATVASASLPAPAIQPSTGAFDSEDYVRTLRRTLGLLMRGAPRPPPRVAGLCMASQRATLVLLDGEDRVAGPAFSWQGTACEAAGAALVARMGAERFRGITGLLPSAIYPVAKLAWLRERDPAALASPRRPCTLHELALLRLGADEALADPSGASATGLWDLGRRRWSREILDGLGLDARRLPRVVPAGSAAGVLDRACARETRLPEGLPLFVGGGDQQCALLGAGSGGTDECLLSLGTSGSLLRPVEPLSAVHRAGPGVLCLAHVEEDRWVLEGFLRGVGSAERWAVDLLGLDTVADLERLAGEAADPVGAAVFLPHLQGSGTPEFDDRPRGALVGASASTDRAAVARAVLDGVAFEIRRAVDAMAASSPVAALRVTGGAASPAMLQRLADCTHLPISASATREAATAGAATLAWRGLGRRPDARARARGGRAGRHEAIYRPARGRRAAVDASYSRYLAAVRAAAALSRDAAWEVRP